MPEPVTLAEAKLYMRIDEDYTYDDAIITMMIQGNREWMEKYLNLSLISKTGLTQRYNRGCTCCEPNRVQIRYGPVVGELAVVTRGITPVTLAYTNVGDDEFPIIYACQNATVTYNVGYTDANIPADLKLALLMLVATNYEQRENYKAEAASMAINKMYPFSRNMVL